MRQTFSRAARGPADDSWEPPGWLLPHQVDAVRRLAGSLDAFSGALCGDAVGLGKTYVGLAVATRYARVTAVVPAVLMEQWQRRAATVNATIVLTSHEALSRGGTVPRADLVIVDEAHRFRNPKTRRYRALARRPPGHLLLLTATPVVNRAADLTALMRLFLADNGLALLGVPSLGEAQARRDHGAVALAASAVTIARSHIVVAGALPHARDARVVSPSPVAEAQLDGLLAGITGLRFPTFADRSAAQLLDLHLRYRLASSRAAARDTLRHHLRYLERALAAATRGERLPRGATRGLIDEADGQLELDFASRAGTAFDAGEIEAERERVAAILSCLTTLPERGPKLAQLCALIAGRAGSKTIVFTAAIATARAIAHELGWREAAVVSGKGAWIASGRISVPEALALFAPDARGAPPPGPARTVATLIATDLASEGLDLQDADAVVHYDLPWTPLRLDQRLGRIARLGSRHSRVDVHWFAPPVQLDADLGLRRRIAGKLATQCQLGVPESSAVGRARVHGRALEWKERLASGPHGQSTPRYAVVAGPPVAIFALSWTLGGRRVPEILGLEGDRRRAVRDPAGLGTLVELLLSSRPVTGADVRPWLEVLHEMVRGRLQSVEQPVCDPEARRLASRIVRRGARAASARDGALLAALDQALSRLLAGVRLGESDLLREALAARKPRRPLEAWVGAHPDRSGPANVTLDAAIFGDGTANALTSRLAP